MEKPRMFSNVRIGGTEQNIPIRMIREMAKGNPDVFMARVNKLVLEKKISLRDFKDLHSTYLALADIPAKLLIEEKGAVRAVTASAFPVLTGTLAIAMIMDAYNAVPTVGQELVEDFDDSKKVTSIAAVHTFDKDVDEVKDTEDFPEIGATEEKVEIRHKMNGRLLKISKSAIEENELPDIVNRINGLGQIAADRVEEDTLKSIWDYDGSAVSAAEPYVYRPDGTGTTLYSATANTPGTRAPSGTCVNSNALVDETDLENARVRLSTMKNNRGKRIAVPYSQIKLVVPDALIGKALKIINSELVPGVENEKSNWGPTGRWNIPSNRIISSPKFDDLSTTAWGYGAPQLQFKRKWKLRFEYVTLGENTESYLKNRTAFQARIAWDCRTGAVDYCFFILCLSGTTMPKDD